MNINVTAFRGVYDAFDLSDGRVGAARIPGGGHRTRHGEEERHAGDAGAAHWRAPGGTANPRQPWPLHIAGQTPPSTIV